MFDIMCKIENLVKKNPSYIALSCGDRNITYSKLWDEVKRISEKISIITKDKLEQVPIAIVSERTVEFVIAMLAVIHSGNYYIPIELPMPNNRIKSILEISHSYLVIDGKDKFDIFDINYKEYHENRRLVYAMFTSGTTGKPKGVKITYDNLCNLVESMWDILYCNQNSQKNVGVLASFSFDSSVKQIYCSLCYGHRLYISNHNDKYFGRKIGYFFKKNNINISDCTPSHIKLMLIEKQKNNVEVFLIGGEALLKKDVQAFYLLCRENVILINVYGPTECCVDVSYYIIKKAYNLIDGYVPIGKPLKNNVLLIKDFRDNIVDTTGVEGELVVEGRQVGAGYIGDNESKAFKILEDGKCYYFTGDIVYYDSDRNLNFVRRKDSQVKIHGCRVELDEIRLILVAHKYIKEAVVIYQAKDDMLICWCWVEEVLPDIRSIIMKYISERVANYMIPKKIKFLTTFPLNINGKVDYKKIKEEMEKYYE